MDIVSSVAAISIKRGTVFHSTIFENIGHGKFFVIIGEGANELVGFFFINSWVNDFIQGKPEMSRLQFPLSQSDYRFLSHNSYLNCASLVTIDKQKLAESISSGETTIKGELSKEDISSILRTLNVSKLYSRVERETYFCE